MQIRSCTNQSFKGTIKAEKIVEGITDLTIKAHTSKPLDKILKNKLLSILKNGGDSFCGGLIKSLTSKEVTILTKALSQQSDCFSKNLELNNSKTGTLFGPFYDHFFYTTNSIKEIFNEKASGTHIIIDLSDSTESNSCHIVTSM